ncbi:MAG: hypothetical protein A3I43_01590 [Omnitrophica WOR_2 bacterium RIFCSPLOWO2_02_FULL_50_19]|nr:MAG: hypothetical protein A3I43_01590 [Omnitrophica WOR_2 bacterium RIFCSPLOWO2_02_FULL_50_19]
MAGSHEQIKLGLINGILRIEVPDKSTLLTGVHRVHLSTVLNFEVAKKFNGYSIQLSPDSLILVYDIANYLRENNILYIVDQDVKRILDQFEGGVSELKAALATGDKLKHKKVPSLKFPHFKRVLKPYQVPAVTHMLQVAHAANFSVPGSGKTSIVLAAFDVLKKSKQIDKLLVVGPRASFMPWEDEFLQCFGRKPISDRISGNKNSRLMQYRHSEKFELILMTYQIASNDINALISLLRKEKIFLVVDESHNIKRLQGGKWADSLLALAPFACKRAILSGTPVPNSLQDIWTQMSFLWPNQMVLGERDEFKFKLGGGEEAVASEIRDKIFPLYWRIQKKDLKLPEPRFHRIEVKMGKWQSAIYNALAAKILADVVKNTEDRQKLRIWRRARMIRLLQSSSNPSLLSQYSTEFKIPPLDGGGLPISELISNYSAYEMPAKIKQAELIARELIKKKQKVIIWSVFILNILTLGKLLKDFKPRIIYGDIPKDENEDENVNREKMIREFKSQEQFPLLIANPSACAESVSLHNVCRHAIYLDRTFNGAQYMQSLDRIHRIGLDPKKHVHYYILKAKDSIDDVVDKRLTEKMARLLRLLNDDFNVLDLDSSMEDITDESGEEADFNAMIKYLRIQANK